MNSLSLEAMKRDAKQGWMIIGGVFLALAVVLFLQSLVFNSSLWVLLQFSYETWQEYLWRMLKIMIVWAGATGVIFTLPVGSELRIPDWKGPLSQQISGFVAGFVFTYILVFVLGILIFIPIGLLSLFIQDIVEYATLEFAWLAAAGILFIWIAVDTPIFLLERILNGTTPMKFFAGSVLILLLIQIFDTIVGLARIIVHSTAWMHRAEAGLLMVAGSLIVTFFVSRRILAHASTRAMIFTMISVYVASVITGNLSQLVFDWGEMPSALLAALVGPVLYSRAAKGILRQGVRAILTMVATFAGMLIGLFAAHYTKLAITGQGWFGILCGTSIVILLGVGVGLVWGPPLVELLVKRTRVRPDVAVQLGIGLFAGIVLGTVFGGFLGR